jgi:hypothetical protein
MAGMVNVAEAWWPVCGANLTLAPPPPLVPSQLSGPRKNSAAAGRSGWPGPVGAQPAMVTCTTAPTGAASGHTLIDPPADSPAPGATDDDAHPATVDAEADVGATGVVVAGAADDSAAAGALDRTVAVWAGTGGLDITVALAVHAAITKVRAQTAPKVKIIRSVGTDLDVGILVSQQDMFFVH